MQNARCLLACLLISVAPIAAATAQDQPMRVPVALTLDSSPVGTSNFQTLQLSAYELPDKSGIFINSLATNAVGKVRQVVVHTNTNNLKTCLPTSGTSADGVACQAVWPRASMKSGVNEIVLWVTLGNGSVVRGSIVRVQRP